jgi:hypothetical protein
MYTRLRCALFRGIEGQAWQKISQDSRFRDEPVMKYSWLALFLLAAGCTTVDVRPVPASAKLDKICIRYNDTVLVDDLVNVLQEDFADHGISSVVFKAEKPATCQFTLDYDADRWWDLAPYLVDAKLTVNKDDAFIGSGHYHLTGHGGFDLAKWAGTHSKIDPVIDKMLEQYPKGLNAAVKTVAAR